MCCKLRLCQLPARKNDGCQFTAGKDASYITAISVYSGLKCDVNNGSASSQREKMRRKLRLCQFIAGENTFGGKCMVNNGYVSLQREKCVVNYGSREKFVVNYVYVSSRRERYVANYDFVSSRVKSALLAHGSSCDFFTAQELKSRPPSFVLSARPALPVKCSETAVSCVRNSREVGQRFKTLQREKDNKETRVRCETRVPAKRCRGPIAINRSTPLHCFLFFKTNGKTGLRSN
ncbi:hypothetical protein J6590_023510 [Homalodisca vitripennis]|nr:hypothetical protein J6590_023510 [Homalodisca vitripennis]